MDVFVTPSDRLSRLANAMKSKFLLASFCSSANFTVSQEPQYVRVVSLRVYLSAYCLNPQKTQCIIPGLVN